MVEFSSLIPILTKYDSTCGGCGGGIPTRHPVLWDQPEHKVYHYGCVGNSKPMPRVIKYDPTTNKFTIEFEWKNRYLETRVGHIAGAYFDGNLTSKDAQTWSIDNLDPVSAKQLLDLAEQYTFGYDVQVLTVLSELIIKGTHTMLQSMARASDFKVKGLKRELFHYQVGGIEFGINNKHVLIADQMGLGKTIEAMGIMSHLELFPAVVVCPAIVKINWQREILAWISKIDIGKVWIIRSRSSIILPPADVYIINYDVLPYWVDQLTKRKPKMIVFDEMHYLKTSTSKRGKAALKLANDREYVIGLTGTPILNRPKELIHQLRVLGRLKELGGKEYVEKRYCAGQMDSFNRWNTNGASNLKELNERLRSSGILIRRLKADVLPDLPKKLPPTIIPLELTNRAEYLKAEKNLARWLGERAVEDEQFKKSIAHLEPLARVRATSTRRSSIEYLARKSEELSKFIYLKRLSTEGKLAGIKEHISEFLDSGEKLLVFGWFIDTQTDLTEAFPQAVHALGKDSDKARATAIDKFQNDPDCQLMIASLKVLGIGVNLTAASHVAFVELGWTPADHDQAEDRVHRIGQTMPVNPYYYVGLDTIEEDIIEIIDNKRKIIAVATDGIEPSHSDVTDILIGRLLAKHKHK